MQRIVALSLFAIAAEATAQHRGGFGPGFARGGVASGGVRQGQDAVHRIGSGLPSVVPYGFGYGDAYLPYDVAAPYVYPLAPSFVIVQLPPSSAVVQAPPREAKAVIHEYAQPVPEPPAQGEPPTFAIVMKDGSVRSAAAVFVTNNVLHYVDPKEENLRISMYEVDREATLKLNRERKLNLWLPSTPRIIDPTAPGR